MPTGQGTRGSTIFENEGGGWLHKISYGRLRVKRKTVNLIVIYQGK